jgi:uncharacterized peroxidase-related enzyme
VEHSHDLRAEVAKLGGAEDAAEISPADRAMLDFAVKLTREPRSIARADVDVLRGHGFSDTAVHDIVQITGFFAYYNRLADGLGIEPETPGI